MSLIGCPFCGELFSRGEESVCPVCGVSLRSIDKLPPSYETRVALEEELSATPLGDRRVAWWYIRRGRGALIAISVLGLIAFFTPWVELHRPDEILLSGYTIARSRGAWFFGGPIGWFVMIPLVVTRRTIHEMRGVRIITALFAALSVVESLQLFLYPPRGSRYVPVAFDWSFGLHATLLLGVLGVVCAVRFGGRVEDVGERKPAAEPNTALSRQRSDEHTLH